MSTTIKRILLTLPIVVIGWLAIMAAVMRFSDAAPAAVVPFPSEMFMAGLPRDASILDLTGVAVTFANRPDLAKTLYQAGAWVVFPAGLTGCLPLSAKQRAALAARQQS